MPRRLEDKAVCFHGMFVPDRRPNGDVVDYIGSVFGQDLNILGIRLQVRQDNGVLIQGIGGGKDCAAPLCTSVGHRFNHDINIPAVV